MGDAKRRKLLCDSYRLEPHCSKQTIEVVGLPEASKLRISGELQKYWATLDPIPSKRLHKLIDVVKDSGGGVCVNLIDAHTIIPPSDLIAKIIPKIPDLSTTATAEIGEILANYDPETELVVISCLPPELPQSIATLLYEHTVLYVITYQYSFVNIYN
ncbi:hypothetical protein [Chamaesiphon minutus]|uniref:Uncharacterized protein n=1 Tax=Chamaesiphon minutus (strain ATCC 27169 / PCC 6605) TaxID=1173020 RepID=K9UDJ3_CHAP6|nr:hypothetical protein [Chamaesiphon minutus]AFY93187.1 hypothetical protein Cha6605_2094 [Chamaesiphon minutus PCC 6605]